MHKNMGQFDRVFRLAAAVVLVALYFTHAVTGVLGLVLLAVAIILALTAVVRFCPLYFPFGLRTNGKEVRHGA